MYLQPASKSSVKWLHSYRAKRYSSIVNIRPPPNVEVLATTLPAAPRTVTVTGAVAVPVHFSALRMVLVVAPTAPTRRPLTMNSICWSKSAWDHPLVDNGSFAPESNARADLESVRVKYVSNATFNEDQLDLLDLQRRVEGGT